MGAEHCADGCGRRGCNGVAGNGWGEDAAGDERARLRGRLRTGNGLGKLRGRLRMAWGATEWVEMGGEKKPLVMSELGCADGLRTANGCGELRGRLRTAWVQGSEMGGEKKPLVMSELGCVDGCGREMGAENCADSCGRRGCKGLAGNRVQWGEEAAGDERARLRGNGWGEEAAGDERAWLRGRLRKGNGCGEMRGRLQMSRVQRNGWKWVGRRSRW